MIASFGEILFDVYPGRELLGGAPFNFLYHVHALTGSGIFISRIGNDDRGAAVRKYMELHSIDQRYVQIDIHKPTGAAFVRLDNAGIPAFTIAEETAYDFIEAENDTIEAMKECDMLYYGTLAQRSETSRTTLYALSREADRCFFDVNLRQQFYSTEVLQRSLVLADIVKLNSEELETIHPMFSSEPFDRDSAARSLLQKFSLSHLAVTDGENGSWLYTEDTVHHHSTTANSVIDTVGAGDGFAAVLCVGILNGLPLEKVHSLASGFSAKVCGINGALPKDALFYQEITKALVAKK